jgi:DNA-binding transcriptional MerR regulator
VDKCYRTSDIAKIIGIHVNTVRLYEKWGLISKPMRLENGYRVFTSLHLEQFKLAREALKIEILQNGLRKKAIDIIKAVASGDLSTAGRIAKDYLQGIHISQKNAMEAIEITKKILSGAGQVDAAQFLTRKETSDLLGVTMDSLRNWELNGLLTVKRKHNGYRVYSSEEINRLRIIRSLRLADYSLSAILRMLNKLDSDPHINIKEVIDTPNADEDIISVCDKLLTSLSHAEKSAKNIILRIKKIKNMGLQPYT